MFNVDKTKFRGERFERRVTKGRYDDKIRNEEITDLCRSVVRTENQVSLRARHGPT